MSQTNDSSSLQMIPYHRVMSIFDESLKDVTNKLNESLNAIKLNEEQLQRTSYLELKLDIQKEITKKLIYEESLYRLHQLKHRLQVVSKEEEHHRTAARVSAAAVANDALLSATGSSHGVNTNSHGSNHVLEERHMLAMDADLGAMIMNNSNGPPSASQSPNRSPIGRSMGGNGVNRITSNSRARSTLPPAPTQPPQSSSSSDLLGMMTVTSTPTVTSSGGSRHSMSSGKVTKPSHRGGVTKQNKQAVIDDLIRKGVPESIAHYELPRGPKPNASLPLNEIVDYWYKGNPLDKSCTLPVTQILHSYPQWSKLQTSYFHRLKRVMKLVDFLTDLIGKTFNIQMEPARDQSVQQIMKYMKEENIPGVNALSEELANGKGSKGGVRVRQDLTAMLTGQR